MQTGDQRPLRKRDLRIAAFPHQRGHWRRRCALSLLGGRLPQTAGQCRIFCRWPESWIRATS